MKQLVMSCIPNIHDQPFRMERLSGYTNVTYAIYIDSVPLYIFKLFADGLDRQT